MGLLINPPSQTRSLGAKGGGLLRGPGRAQGDRRHVSRRRDVRGPGPAAAAKGIGRGPRFRERGASSPEAFDARPRSIST